MKNQRDFVVEVLNAQMDRLRTQNEELIRANAVLEFEKEQLLKEVKHDES